MDKDTLTLALEGTIGLEDFARAVQHFSKLVGALSVEVSGDAKIEWWISDLASGSAIATIQGVSEIEGVVGRVVDAYAQVGDALSKGEAVPFSQNVRNEANSLTRLLNGHITQVRFETADVDFIVVRGRAIKYAYGSIKGTVQTLSMRKGLKFTLYDAIFDRAISCYLQQNQQEAMREAWGKQAIVSGRVGREPDHGYPVSVRDVKDIRIITPVKPGSYRRARGVIPWHEGDEPADVVIRRLRDAG